MSSVRSYKEEWVSIEEEEEEEEGFFQFFSSGSFN